MSNYSYKEIRDEIIGLNQKLPIEIRGIVVKNSKTVLIIDYDFSECIAQISVTNLENTPYQYVFMDVMDNTTSNSIYNVFDDEKSEKITILKKLEKAIEFCENYRGK